MPTPIDVQNNLHPLWVVSSCTILVVKDADCPPSFAIHDMGWLHVWVLFGCCVLAESFSSALLWVSQIEDEQGVVNLYCSYLLSMD